MARLEASQQFVQRGQHLPCQTCRDNVLVFATGGEDRRELLLLFDSEEAVGGEQHVEGGEERPSRDLDHFRDAESEKAARFAPWSVNQADGLLVDEQSGWYLRFAQQALKTSLRAGRPL